MAGDPFTAAIFRWLKAVAADPTQPPSALECAFAMSQRINRASKTAWPGRDVIANDMGLSGEDETKIRHVNRCLKSLTDGGYLLPRRRKQSSTIYKLALQGTPLSFQEDETANDPDGDCLSNAESRKDASVLSSELEKTSASSSKDTGVPIKGHQCPTEPLNEPLNEPEGGRRARAKPLPSDFGLDVDAFTWAVDRLGTAEAVRASMFKFTNHHQSLGSRFADWTARARLWIEDDARKAEKAIADDKSVVAAAKRLSETLRSFDAGPTAVVLSTDEWRKALTLFQRTGTWSKYVDVYGSAPPSPDCKAPRHLLIEFGLLREDAA